MTMDYATVSQRTNTYARAEMLAHAQDVQILNLYGDIIPLPKNKAKTITMRRWNPPAVPLDGSGNPVPLTEGVEPAARDHTYEDVVITMKQFGGYEIITDVVSDLAEDNVRQHATQANGEQAGTYAELECWGALRGGTNVKYANGTARNQVNTPVSATLLAGVERILRANKGKEITSCLAGSVKIATVPVPRAYILFGHTDLKYDLEALPNFSKFETYIGQDGKMSRYEVGRYGSFRVILSPTLTKWADAGAASSTMVSTSGTNADVYPLIAIARNSYAHVPVKGKKAIIPQIIQPDTPSAGDRLGQKGSVGYKMYYASGITNQAWVVRCEVAATLL